MTPFKCSLVGLHGGWRAQEMNNFLFRHIIHNFKPQSVSNNPKRPRQNRGLSDGAKVLGKLPLPGRPTIWIIVGQGPIALAVGAGGGCLDIFSLIYLFSFLSPSLWETARYRLKYCLKGPLSPKQPTNHVKTTLTRQRTNIVNRRLQLLRAF